MPGDLLHEPQGHLRVARAELAGLLCTIKSGKHDL
jgi:hypothetical protein